jgi:hypothetical protein
MKSFEQFLAEEYTYKPFTNAPSSASKCQNGHVVGTTSYSNGYKGANIVKHHNGKFYASGGSSTAITKKTTFHDTAEEAAKSYHDRFPRSPVK